MLRATHSSLPAARAAAARRTLCWLRVRRRLSPRVRRRLQPQAVARLSARLTPAGCVCAAGCHMGCRRPRLFEGERAAREGAERRGASRRALRVSGGVAPRLASVGCVLCLSESSRTHGRDRRPLLYSVLYIHGYGICPLSAYMFVYVCYWTVRVRASVLRKGKLSEHGTSTLAHRRPAAHTVHTDTCGPAPHRTRSRRPSGHRELNRHTLDAHSRTASPRLSAPLRASPRLSAPSRPRRHNFGLGRKPVHTQLAGVRRALGER